MDDNRIIAIRKRDLCMASQAFADLMLKTKNLLNDDARINPSVYRSYSSSELEECSVEKIKLACNDSPFDANEVRLISGQRFPDIIAEKYYGIEVKMTKKDHWTSVGGSIVESTRDKFVEDIYVLFAKMGGSYPEFMCRPYQEVMSDITVTHSPRYLIDMKLDDGQTIFDKMNVSYDDLRTDPYSIDKIRDYYRQKAVENNKQQMPWWITTENSDEGKSMNVSLWNSLSFDERKRLKAMCMILFPEAMNPKGDKKKYNQTTLWLCSYKQIVMPNVRDLYTAGGQITHIDGEKLEIKLPQIINQIVSFSDYIKEMLENPSMELIMLIQNYNPSLLSGKTMWDEWLKICSEYIKCYNVDLESLIILKPRFTFSK